jgi:hypothetical protein
MIELDGDLTVVGSLNLDVIGTTGCQFLRTDWNDQDYADWTFGVGGTATNIAIIAAKRGLRTNLIAIIGSDWVGQYAIDQLFRQNIQQLRVFRFEVPDISTGVVVIAYLSGMNGSTIRKVIGPTKSPLDFVEVGAIVRMLAAVPPAQTVILDGYMFRMRQSQLSPIISSLRSREARVCIELVPHEIWKLADNQRLLEVIGNADHISSNISTMERLVGIDPSEDSSQLSRVNRLARKLTVFKGRPILHLRSGKEGAEHVVIFDTYKRELITKSYDLATMSTKKSFGDEFFLDELFC